MNPEQILIYSGFIVSLALLLKQKTNETSMILVKHTTAQPSRTQKNK